MALFRAKPTPQTKPAPPPPVGTQPWGVPGSWQLVFDDEFDGDDLDTRWWSRTTWGGAAVNGVATSADNVAVVNGELVLTLSAEDVGASINTNPTDHYSTPGKVGFEISPPSVVEARVSFPGDGAQCWNWCCWWTSGQDWPNNGELDIAETLGGTPEIWFHGPQGAVAGGAPSGYWGGWHTYTAYRAADRVDVYYDGALKASIPAKDRHGPHCLILTIGNRRNEYTRIGESMRVDYVRVWTPATG